MRRVNWKEIGDYLQDFNPWPRIRLIPTNVVTDILTGITVASIALPLALGFGVASGLGPIAGVYGAIAGGLFGGLFGGTNVGMSGPTGPKTVQLAMILQDHRLPDGSPDAAFAFGCVFLSGLIMIALASLKVGRFIYYTPYSVISGFMCAIGAILLVQQFRPFVGLPVLPSIKEAFLDIPSAAMQARFDALLVSVATLAVIVVWPRFVKALWLPAPLIGLMVGTLLANLLGFKIDYLPTVPMGMPEAWVPPLSRIGEMFVPAAALAGLAVYDSLLTAIVIDQKTADRHNSDQEVFGQGMANAIAGLFGGLTTATATMRSMASITCGAKSILAAMTMGAVLLSLVLGLAPLATYIPMPALAAILYKVGWDILDWRVFPVLRRLSKTDKICFWVVFLVTMSVDLLVAVGLGLSIAFFRFVKEMSDLSAPKLVSLQDPADPLPGRDLIEAPLRQRIGVVQPEGPLFFGVADKVYRTSQYFDRYDVVIVLLNRVPVIDLSGAFALEDLIEYARERDTEVLLAELAEPVARELESLGILAKVGRENCFESLALAAARARGLVSARNHHSLTEVSAGVEAPF